MSFRGDKNLARPRNLGVIRPLEPMDDVQPDPELFHTDIRVRFADVDHAGIIFFAKIFEYCHCALEDLQRQAGIPLESFFSEARRLGAPLVDARAAFYAPFRHGVLMRVEVGFEKLGERSVHTRFRCFLEDGKLGAEVRFVQSFIDTATFRSRSIPDDVRAALAPYAIGTRAPLVT